MMYKDLLFELGTEELPSGSVWPLAKELGQNLSEALLKAELSFGEIHCFATPRRLAVKVTHLIEQQPDQAISRKGPAVDKSYDNEGMPSKALLGFARSCGVEIDELTQTETEKGAWWSYHSSQQGVRTCDLLPQLIEKAVLGLSIPKPMRWGNFDEGFTRPVHWALLLFGQDVIDLTILGVTSGRESFSHRFHHPGAIPISSIDDYEALLQDAKVIVDFDTRRQLIQKQVSQLAEEKGFRAIMPDDLIDEVTSIVEWPKAMLVSFDKAFLSVPPEALIASMQSHQKCFALTDADGMLQPYFITVSNIESAKPEQVINGNQKVMRARLSDADFFYKQDKKQPLAAFAESTARVKFQDKLGSLKDKTERMKEIMKGLAKELHLNHEEAIRACELSKADLMTGMVGEFPELQGLMGYYYALHHGEPETIATAIMEQYLPKFSGDGLPQTSLGAALSLADRLDTLVGIMGIGQKPSGVKDPFKLRRHALAVVRLLIDLPVNIEISSLIDSVALNFDSTCALKAEFVAQLKPFIIDRLASFYQNQNISQDVVQAVIARQDECFRDADSRIKALVLFTKLPEALSLSAACKRVNNILQKSGFEMEMPAIQPELFQQAQENNLFELIHVVEKHIDALLEKGAYQEILFELAKLKESVDAFFDDVMIMVDDEQVKANRLGLLKKLQQLLTEVADISMLSIEQA